GEPGENGGLGDEVELAVDAAREAGAVLAAAIRAVHDAFLGFFGFWVHGSRWPYFYSSMSSSAPQSTAGSRSAARRSSTASSERRAPTRISMGPTTRLKPVPR